MPRTMVHVYVEDPLCALVTAVRESGQPDLATVVAGAARGDAFAAAWAETRDVASMATVLLYAGTWADRLAASDVRDATFPGADSVEYDQGRYRYRIAGLPHESYIVVDFEDLWTPLAERAGRSADALRVRVPTPPSLARLIDAYGQRGGER